ncbi:GNAT family N-acetyltransferase [Tateyamaria sp. syn59]|uniref:GNAT family N-acetyltransferase n=1 Tax=Tateyamaria sp. syn59 TaxID=2576942 RepID=UPI001CB8E629|nr:GNAT family N-acetyltransferase [Tateyamaria sp. syn59]
MTGITDHIPTLETERLVLRAPSRADFPAFAAYCASPRATFSWGQIGADRAWAEFAAAIGSWSLMGFGAWSIEDRATGTYCGEILLQHPAHFPEPELGWTLMEESEGKGIAYEAAVAARDWFTANHGDKSLVSYITPGNTRSEALATRLGATHDPDAPLPDGETANETAVYRHRRAA